MTASLVVQWFAEEHESAGRDDMIHKVEFGWNFANEEADPLFNNGDDIYN